MAMENWHVSLMDRKKQKKLKEKEMANKIMHRDEAKRFIEDNGWKLFLDKLISDKVIVFENKLTIDITDNNMVVIKRHGKVVYED